MTVIAYWRTGNTRPGIRVPIDLGTDPETDEARVLAADDEVTLIMRNGAAPAQLRDCTVESLDPPIVSWKPEDGDFDDPGTYDVVFDITDAATDVETIPDREATSYQFLIGAKPNDT